MKLEDFVGESVVFVAAEFVVAEEEVPYIIIFAIPLRLLRQLPRLDP